MRNNTILVGELLGLNSGRIKFDGDGIGEVSIKHDKIKSIKANTHYYRIETVGNKLLYGYIDTSGKTGFIKVSLAGDTSHTALTQITALAIYGQSFGASLTGLFGAGFSYTRSSNITRFNLDGNIKYAVRRMETGMKGSMIITADSIKSQRERESLQGYINYLINNRWYGGALLSYQRNIELGLKSRWQSGFAIGYKFFQNSHNMGKALSGIVLNRESNFQGSNNTFSEWATQVNYNFFSFRKPDMTISATETFYVSLSQKGRTRADGDIRVSWKIIKDFSFSLSFYHNYDSKSPGTNTAKLDYGYLANINFEF